MNKNKLIELNYLIAKVFEVDADGIKPETTFVNDLNASSMTRIFLSCELMDLTGIKISEAKLKYMNTVSELYDAVSGWLNT